MDRGSSQPAGTNHFPAVQLDVVVANRAGPGIVGGDLGYGPVSG